MKKLIHLFICLFALQLNAQTYPSQNINLIGHIHPNTGTVGIAQGGQRYSGCWAWYQANKNKEYAISGGSSGTYFIDISNPSTPSVSAYVPGRAKCVWREIKTYQNYCYVVSDDSPPNRFQIIDMQYLPDSVHVIEDSWDILMMAHTIWIDNDKLYTSSTTYTNSYTNMAVYSLATPTAPVLLRQLANDYPMIQQVHDLYSRNDTIFANCGYQGLYLFTLTSSNTFSQVGSYTNYAPGSNYNHSSYLTQNGKYLVFCDEVPSGLPIRIVDVQNFANITPVSSFIPYTTSVPHNPYVKGDSLLIVSSYQDGLQVYNIKDPFNPYLTGYFDTYPQGGAPVGTYSNYVYKGNWGAHVWLPSGLIVANDMQNGIFILDPAAAYTTTNTVTLPLSTVGLQENQTSGNQLRLYPNPANESLFIQGSNKTKGQLQLINLLGEIVHEKITDSFYKETLNVSGLKEGAYVLKFFTEETTSSQKIIIQHH